MDRRRLYQPSRRPEADRAVSQNLNLTRTGFCQTKTLLGSS
jgi:hypothetical protein